MFDWFLNTPPTFEQFSHTARLMTLKKFQRRIWNRVKNLWWKVFLWKKPHSVKSVRIRNYSGPHFPAFRLNTERYFASLHIRSECGKMRTRITPNTENCYAVTLINKAVRFRGFWFRDLRVLTVLAGIKT